MKLDDFIIEFQDQFELEDEDFVMQKQTEFKNLDDWDSLVALSVIAMVDDKFNASLTGDDIRGANTIEDLYLLIKNKKA